MVDLEVGEDIVALRGLGIDSLAELLGLASQDGHDLVLDFERGDFLRLEHVDLQSFDAIKFIW